MENSSSSGDSKPLSMEDIEALATKSLLNFGRADKIIMYNGFTFYPRFIPLSWSELYDLDKKQLAIASLHIFLFKLGCLKNMTEEDHNYVVNCSCNKPIF